MHFLILLLFAFLTPVNAIHDEQTVVLISLTIVLYLCLVGTLWNRVRLRVPIVLIVLAIVCPPLFLTLMLYVCLATSTADSAPTTIVVNTESREPRRQVVIRSRT